MSKLGGAVAFVAEAGIWVAGAALVASAAGMHWDTPQVDMNSVLGPAASASPSISASPTPSPIPTLAPVPTDVPVFAKAAELHASVAKLTTASGAATGTIRCGFQSQKIGGSVGFSAKGSSIALTGDGKPANAEVVAGGKRYVRDGSGPWVDRGPKQTTTTLQSILSNTPTTTDIGVQAFAGQQLHRIESAVDNLNAAEAFGFDTHGWANSSGSVRIWSTDSGVAAGFGTSILWSESLSGVLTDCRIDVDVKFDARPKVAVAAPSGAWKWETDSAESISYAVPASWGKVAQPADPFKIEWTASGVMYMEASTAAAGNTLDAAVAAYSKPFTDAGQHFSAQVDVDLGGEHAVLLPLTALGRYQCSILGIHYDRIYIVAYTGGTSTGKAMCDALISTIQFA